MSTDPVDMMTTQDVADFLDVAESTVRSYHARGQMPDPDGQLGRTPWWSADTITEWEAQRTAAARSQQQAAEVSE